MSAVTEIHINYSFINFMMQPHFGANLPFADDWFLPKRTPHRDSNSIFIHLPFCLGESPGKALVARLANHEPARLWIHASFDKIRPIGVLSCDMGVTIPPPFPLTLPYQSCVVERSEWRLCICGPPTQGWVSIFRASFGGDRQHGAGDGGQNVGTDGKTRFLKASCPSAVNITTLVAAVNAEVWFDGRNWVKRLVRKGGGERRGD